MPWLEPEAGKPLGALIPPGILATWTRLAISSNQADPFCCAPDWQLAFHEVFSPARRVYYNFDRWAGIIFAEYVAKSGEAYLLPLEDSWLFGQPLLGDEAPLLLADCLPDLLAGSDAARGIYISGIREPSTLASGLFQRFYPEYSFYRYGRDEQASASLEGGVDGWLSRRSANHRAKLRKAARKAAAAGMEFERIRPDRAGLVPVYNRILNIEARSWKGLGCCGMDQEPSRSFYFSLLGRLAARGDALVIFAMLDGRDIGFVFGGLCGPFYRGQQFSYDRDYAGLSPGNLLQLAKISWLCELGILRYDMGPATGERMQYKIHWAEQTRNLQTWVMRRQPGPGKIIG